MDKNSKRMTFGVIVVFGIGMIVNYLLLKKKVGSRGSRILICRSHEVCGCCLVCFARSPNSNNQIYTTQKS